MSTKSLSFSVPGSPTPDRQLSLAPASPTQRRQTPLVRSFSVAQMPEITPKDQSQKELQILAHLFGIMNEQQDPNTAKGHFAALMRGPLYKDQMMRVFNESLKSDEKELLDKYQSLNRAREKYSKALKEKNSDAMRGLRSDKYHHRRRKFKKFARVFSATIQSKYGIDISKQLRVPNDWVDHRKKFKLQEGQIKSAIVKSITTSFPEEFKIYDEVHLLEKMEKLFRGKDYDVLNSVDLIGGSRSYKADFYKKVDEIFRAYCEQKLPPEPCEAPEELKKELRDLYLTKEMGKCNAILLTIRALAHDIGKNANPSKPISQEPVPAATKIGGVKEGSWIKLVKLIDPTISVDPECLTPRKIEVSTFNNAKYETPLPALTKDLKKDFPFEDLGKGYRIAIQELLDSIKKISAIYVSTHHPSLEQDPVKQNEKKTLFEDAVGRILFLQALAITQLVVFDQNLPSLRKEMK